MQATACDQLVHPAGEINDTSVLLKQLCRSHRPEGHLQCDAGLLCDALMGNKMAAVSKINRHALS